MAHYVAKVLKIRPSEILDTWCIPELIVAFGVYRNEEQQKHFNEIKEFNKSNPKKPMKQIDEYAVRFYTLQDLESEDENGNN